MQVYSIPLVLGHLDQFELFIILSSLDLQVIRNILDQEPVSRVLVGVPFADRQFAPIRAICNLIIQIGTDSMAHIKVEEQVVEAWPMKGVPRIPHMSQLGLVFPGVLLS